MVEKATGILTKSRFHYYRVRDSDMLLEPKLRNVVDSDDGEKSKRLILLSLSVTNEGKFFCYVFPLVRRSLDHSAMPHVEHARPHFLTMDLIMRTPLDLDGASEKTKEYVKEKGIAIITSELTVGYDHWTAGTESKTVASQQRGERLSHIIAAVN